MPVTFHIEPPLKYSLKNRQILKKWLKNIVEKEGKWLSEVNFIFCTDDYLYQLNATHLNHHTYTDIITFDNSDSPHLIEGDIFISIDRITENAQKYHVTTQAELLRVMAHGILHLLGYKDKKREDQKLMRLKENECIALFEQLSQPA